MAAPASAAPASAGVVIARAGAVPAMIPGPPGPTFGARIFGAQIFDALSFGACPPRAGHSSLRAAC